jgi:glycosyltransferase involved in cell wall biosynthesis
MTVKILHVIDTLGAGGAERQLFYLLSGLDLKRFDAAVLTIYDDFQHYRPQIEELGIPVYSLRHGKLDVPHRMCAMMRYIRLVNKMQPQLIHSWLHYSNLVARLARPFCRPHRLIASVRTEYTARQIRSELLTEKFSNLRIVNSKKPIQWKSNIETISIPNALPIEKFATNPTLINHNGDRFTLLIVARIDPRKDHQTLLEALSLLREELPKNFKTILIGEVTSLETQQKLEQLILNYRLQEYIEQLPSTHEIVPLYQQTDVVVLPSKTEGFSNVILEAFAAGKPIIVSSAANNNHLVENDENGWVFSTGNSDALAKCIKQAWQTSNSDIIKMGHLGRAIAQNYDVGRMVEQYRQVYERLSNDSYKRS